MYTWAAPSAARRDNYVGSELSSTRLNRRDAVRALTTRAFRFATVVLLRADDVVDFEPPSQMLNFVISHSSE